MQQSADAERRWKARVQREALIALARETAMRRENEQQMGITWRTSEADTLEAKAASIGMAEAALSDALEALDSLEQRQAGATLTLLEHARARCVKRARLLRSEP